MVQGPVPARFGETFMRVWYRFLYTSVSGITSFIAIYLISQVPDQVFGRAALVPMVMHAYSWAD